MAVATTDPPPRKRGKDPDPPDGDDPDGGDDPEVTEVKISRREADKVVVPSFPAVTQLLTWTIGWPSVLPMSSVHAQIQTKKN